MSRTMKANEAISALAFLSNPEELISVQPSFTGSNNCNHRNNNVEDNSNNNNNNRLSKSNSLGSNINNNNNNKNNNNGLSKNKSLGSNIGDKIASVFQKVFSDPNMADLNVSGPVSNTSLQKISSSTNDITAVTSSSTNNGEHKGVCFGTVEVRKFPITIGDTPSCSSGLPHTIEWDYLKDETEKHGIDEYERDHPVDGRKHGDDLVMNGITRAKMLKNLGYTKQELLEGMKQVTETKAMSKNPKRKSDAKSSRISVAR
jgi:hypothetical protein